jgi:regulator of RNase E activity RraA
MKGRFRITSWQERISVGGVAIAPGDLIFADIDGVIVVPRDRAYDVLIAAEQIKRNEVGIREMINDGATPRDVVERGGYF